jgi:hypothetical protein
MSASVIPLVGNIKVATEQIVHAGQGVVHAQHVIASELGVVPLLVPKYLATNPGAAIEMNVNGSVTPAQFELRPSSVQIWRVARLVVQIIAPAPAAANQFGSLAELANGILLEVRNATLQLIDLTAGQPIKANRDFGLGWSTSIADDIVGAEWLLEAPLRLEGGLGEFLRLTVRDNLTTLTRMRVLALVLEETTLT